MESLLLALAIGFVSGLRTFTSLAALSLSRGIALPGIILGIGALGEYVADASPKIPSRTAFPSIVVRPVSGAIAGWFITAWHGGSPVAGAVAGAVGALIGTYGGHAARSAAIEKIGGVPAAIAEDVVAIALAVLIVSR